MEFTLYENEFPLFGGELLESFSTLGEFPSSPQECDLASFSAVAEKAQPKTDLLQNILDQTEVLEQPLQSSWMDTKVDLLEYLQSDMPNTAAKDCPVLALPVADGKTSAIDLLNSLGQAATLAEVDSGLAEALSSLTEALGVDVPPETDPGQPLSPVSVEDIESLLSEQASPAPTATTQGDEDSFATILSDLQSDTSSHEEDTGPIRSKTSKSRRKAPYGSTKKDYKTTDRKERKKQQNKDAALRYRSKKRSEQEVLNDVADELEEKNKVLREKVDSISKEIQYLKDLMAEVHKAKGLSK